MAATEASLAGGAFLKRLPKAELHAHLHGCVRRSTLRELAAAAGSVSAPAITLPDATRSLSDCFAMFGAIHAVVRTSAAVSRIVREALEDAHADGVWYVELRTTPRRLDDAAVDAGAASGCSGGGGGGDGAGAGVGDDMQAIRHYVGVVVAAFEEWARDGGSCSVGGAGSGHHCLPRLLLSLNRTGSM